MRPRLFLIAITASTLVASDTRSETQIVLTVVSWGGAYQTSQQKAFAEPYMSLNPSVRFTWDESSAEAVARLRAMAETDNTTWDLVDVVASDAIRLCDEGLAMEIEHDELLAPAPNGAPASADFGDLLISDCFIPQVVYSTAFGYRTDVAEWNGEEPDDVCDIFDLETFPGRRTLERRPINNMEWALLCSGVPKARIYEVLETTEGQDRAFAKLDEIKDEVIWWTSGAEAPQLLADAEVVFGSAYNGRLFTAIEEQNQPLKIMWDAQVFDLDGWIVPAGIQEGRRQAVFDFVRFSNNTQRLADLSRYIPYGLARASSNPLVGSHVELDVDMARHIPTHPENMESALLYNYEWWADYRDDLEAKFQAWLVE